MASRAHAKFGGRDQATARGEGAAFGADEAIIDAVGEARIGTPYRFDHFGLTHIVGLAANERRHAAARRIGIERGWRERHMRSEEHTSELQSLMRISYAVFRLKKKKKTTCL